MSISSTQRPELIAMRPVSTEVNSVRHDGPGLVAEAPLVDDAVPQRLV